jgi:glucose-6-phosphate 1-dehydrogenase
MCLEPAKGIEGVEQGDGKEYSALITSALCGDSTYFLSDPEMKAQWQIAEELQEGLSRAELKKYPKGISYKEFCNDKWCST